MNDRKSKTTAVLKAFQIAAMVFGGVSAAIAESSHKDATIELPMFSLEDRTQRSQTNLGQDYRIEIYGDRTVVFHGILNTRVIGEARGKLSRQQFSSIYSGFVDIRFLELDPVYGPDSYPSERIIEGESCYTLIFRSRGVERKVQVSSAIPKGTVPGIHLLIDHIKRVSGARQWACPALATPSLGGDPMDVCQFPE